jgi:O-antigen/teichoic acid export membrane protein
VKFNLLKGHRRTVQAKKHILASFAFKGASIVVSFIFVPLILGYLDAERYGIWLTLSSIIGWVSFFDIGLGNGLRNRLTEAIAIGDHNLAKTYVSTTYAILGIILMVIIVLFSLINPFLNWQKILNSSIIIGQELSIIAMIIFVFFILRFFFKLIGTILMADQRPAINNAFGPIGNVIALVIIFILTKTIPGSLTLLSIVLSIIPVLVLFIATIYFFNNDYKKYRPEIEYIDMTKSSDLLSLGFKFFYFQIASLIFFSTSNFLIAQLSDQKAVAEYNIAYKYFFIVNMVYGIILTPFWSAVTDAYSKNDFKWIKRLLNKLNLLSLLMASVLFVMLLCSNYIYTIWVGNKIIIPFRLSAIIMIYMLIQLFVAPYSTFINGIGKLKFGLFLITFKLLIYLPTALILGRLHGAFGIVSAMAIVQIPSLVFEPLQVYLILSKKAKGIWNS